MTSTWKKLPEEIPTNGETVYIRVQFNFSHPFEAQWNGINKSFTSVENEIMYPAWTVTHWKSM